MLPPRAGREAGGRGPPGEEVNGLFPGRACGGRGMFTDEGDAGDEGDAVEGGRGIFTGGAGVVGGIAVTGLAALSGGGFSPRDGGALGFDS